MYESFFGLTRLPFQLSPDRSFLFEGKGHRDTLAAVRRGLASGAQVMLVTGEVGAGKTTLLHALVRGVDPKSTTAVLTSAAHLDAGTLVDRVFDALGLSLSAASDTKLDALRARLDAKAPGVFLIIDEAQHLEPSAFELLETLTNRTSGAAGTLQVCLVGQPELRLLLSVPELARFRHEISVDRHLRLLEQEETRAYVEHRLQRAGWNGRPRFEDGAFLEIFVFTSGIPRRINQLCNSLLFSACLNGEQVIDASAVTREAAAMRAGAFPATPAPPRTESRCAEAPARVEQFERIALPEEAGPDASPLSSLAERIALDTDPVDETALARRRRRQAIVTITASATIATALIGYAMNRQAASVAAPAGAARHTVAAGSVTPLDPPSAVAASARASASPTSPVSPTWSASVPVVSGAISPTDVAASAADARACNAQVLALGLCETNPPPSPRP